MTDIELNRLKNRYEVNINFDEYYSRYFIWLKSSFILEGTKDHFFVTVDGDDSYNYVEKEYLSGLKNFILITFER